MAVVKELIRNEADGTLSFGDYTLSEKTKKDFVGDGLCIGRDHLFMQQRETP